MQLNATSLPLNRPLRFHPVFRSYLWGGDRLERVLHKPVPSPGIWAESWEIVDHGSDQTVVAQGPLAGRSLADLVRENPTGLFGAGPHPKSFPLLLKYLDCNRVLSVQVHPDDAYGATMPKPDLGKTEAWYVLHAEPNAKIYAGLQSGIDAKKLRGMIEQGTSEDALHVLYPNTGDCVFIPAGTVHALGEGLLVAEIQQASDTTFRLFDWNRVDDQGNSRPLHIEQAMEVIDFERGPVEFAKPESMSSSSGGTWERLVACDKFNLDRYPMGSFPISSGEFSIVTIAKGKATIESATAGAEVLSFGETVLIPADCQQSRLHVEADSIVLVATAPRGSWK